MKNLFTPLLLVATALQAADVHSSRQIAEASEKLLSKGAPFASADMGRYGGHYAMLAVRNTTGSAEVHEHEADYFIVEKGSATLITGGTVQQPKVQKAGEIRGTSISGGEKHALSGGDIVEIPAGQPHQLIIEKGKTFSYFVVKVQGQ